MTDAHLSVDTLFDLLKKRQRRYLLYSLDQQVESVVTLEELAAMVAEWERRMDGERDEPTVEDERRVRLSLHHKHLPKLAELGLVEYDSRSETVRKQETPPVATLVDDGHDEVPHLRSLFCASVTE